MHRALCALIAVSLICGSAKVSVATRKSVEATKGQFHNGITINGLHVALPTDMKDFPTELVAQP